MFKLKTVAIAAGLFALPAVSQAAGPTLSDVLGNSGISLSGAIDAGYDWADSDGINNIAFMGGNDNTFALHQVNLLVTKDFGSGVSATVNGVLGDDAGALGGTSELDLFQGYLSYASGGLTVSGGKFATLAGYEVVNPAGNSTATRSILFGLQPLAHTGVRASYKINDTLAVTAGLVNSINVAPTTGDNNSDKTVEAQVAFTPSKALSFYLTGYTGTEDTPVGAGLNGGVLTTNLVDFVASLTLSDMLSVALNADWGNTEDGTGGENDAMGVAAYVTAKLSSKLSLTARGEYVNIDNTAPGTDGSQNLTEGTLSASYALTPALNVVAEYRADNASDTGVATAYTQNGVGGDSSYQNVAVVRAILKF